MGILIAYLVGIFSAILPKHVYGENEKSKAGDESSKPQPAAYPERISAEINLSPKEAKRYYCEENKTYKLQRRIFWVNFITLLALALYTFFTYRILCATQKSAHAAKSAVDIAQKELVRTNRPWLGADHLIFTAPVRIVNIGGAPDLYMLQALMAYKYEIRNYGKDPALRVHYHAESIEFRLGTDVVDAAQDMSCKMADGEFFKDIGNGAAIFPNDFLDATNDNAPGILIQPRKIFGNKAPDTANGRFFIAGCASYVDQFFDITKTVHHTRFCFISDIPLRQVGNAAELRRCRREIRAD